MKKLSDKEMLEQLYLQEKDLLQKLKFIREGIITYGGNITEILSVNNKENEIHNKFEYEKEGTWSDKVLCVLGEIGSGFANDIIDKILEKEPDLDRENTTKAVTVAASKLFRGKITGKKIRAKRIGKKYKYSI